MVISACVVPIVIDVSRDSALLKPHPQQQQQIDPKPVHEMPVTGGRVQSALSQSRVADLANHPEQAAQATEHMHGMDRGQYIEKRTVGVGGQIQTLGSQLCPRQSLACYE